MRRATHTCIAAAGRWPMASAIPATPIPRSWMRGACRPCWLWPMPDKANSEENGAVPFLPYGRQEIADADVKAVVEALCSGWLTTGPRVSEFEQAFAAQCGTGEGVAVNSGTAALHCAMRALRIKPGDEVIVPAITFAASANAAL